MPFRSGLGKLLGHEQAEVDEIVAHKLRKGLRNPRHSQTEGFGRLYEGQLDQNKIFGSINLCWDSLPSEAIASLGTFQELLFPLVDGVYSNQSLSIAINK